MSLTLGKVCMFKESRAPRGSATEVVTVTQEIIYSGFIGARESLDRVSNSASYTYYSSSNLLLLIVFLMIPSLK